MLELILETSEVKCNQENFSGTMSVGAGIVREKRLAQRTHCNDIGQVKKSVKHVNY